MNRIKLDKPWFLYWCIFILLIINFLTLNQRIHIWILYQCAKFSFKLNILIDWIDCMNFLWIILFISAYESFAQYVTIGEARFLVHNGYRYYKNSRNNGNVYWLCQGYQRYGCSARAITKNYGMKITKGTHKHSPVL